MSYTHLIEKIDMSSAIYKVAGFSLREIARRLNRHHSTISRELKRANSRYPYAVYWHDWAQPLAIKRFCKGGIFTG